jgi:hypothetical protein
MSISTSMLRQWPRPAMAIALVIGALFALAAVLWVHYGSAVFYEMIVAGIAACL